MSKKEWYDPKEILPDTTGGERDEDVTRVFVVVKAASGKKYHCQFWRRNRESGGAFCGLPYVQKRDFSGFYFDELVIGSVTFGETSYYAVDDIEIIAWRYDDRLKRCKLCGHKAKVMPEIDGYWYVVCKKYCTNCIRETSRQEAVRKWNEAQK